MSALQKNKIEKIKAANAKSMARRKTNATRLAAMASGGAGAGVSAVGCALIDATNSDAADDQRMIGKSPVPWNAALGVGSAVVGFLMAKKSPVAGSFFYQGGITAVGITVYGATRAKLEELEDERARAAREAGED